jgi:small subunit ribosomal protein S1
MSNNMTPTVAWDEDEGYSKEEYKRLAQRYEDTLMDYTEKRLVKGSIVSIDDREVVVNIGFKSEGVIPISEFRDVPNLKINDPVEVYLDTIENKSGQMIISRRLANSIRTWERINNALDEDIIMEGTVKRRTKGGFVVDLEGIEAFLPGSQIDVKPIKDYDFYVGQRMEFKVVKINHAQHNVVISHKALIEKDLEAQRAEIINNLDRGQVLEGEVKNITDFGVFIDLGGVDGLLHITDISWGRINSPRDVISDGQRLNVVVLDFDEAKKRISLGLKQLTPHPWDNLDPDMAIGTKVKGKVVTIAEYGIFIEIMPGVEGLIHVSEMSWSQHPKIPAELFAIGQEITAVVLTLDRDERKMSLGIKQLSEEPWKVAAEKYPIASKHTGTVRNITSYGLFVELEEGIDGLIHVGDLSWSRKISHPSEFIQKDEKIEIIVLEIDSDNRRLRLGHKQLTEDPWETLESVFPVGSSHSGTVTKLVDKGTGAGAIVELEYGIEGFIPAKHLKAEPGTDDIKEGMTIPCKVIEFNKDTKRIHLSHAKVWQEKLDALQPKSAATDATDDVIEYVNVGAGTGTLGEMAQLSSLGDALKAAEDQSESVATAVAEAPAVAVAVAAPAVVAEVITETVVAETPAPTVVAAVEAAAETVVAETPAPAVVAAVEATAETVVAETPAPTVVAAVEAVAETVVAEAPAPTVVAAVEATTETAVSEVVEQATEAATETVAQATAESDDNDSGGNSPVIML